MVHDKVKSVRKKVENAKQKREERKFNRAKKRAKRKEKISQKKQNARKKFRSKTAPARIEAKATKNELSKLKNEVTPSQEPNSVSRARRFTSRAKDVAQSAEDQFDAVAAADQNGNGIFETEELFFGDDRNGDGRITEDEVSSYGELFGDDDPNVPNRFEGLLVDFTPAPGEELPDDQFDDLLIPLDEEPKSSGEDDLLF